MIQITDTTIENIAQDLLDNFIEQYGDETPLTLDQACEATENWLRRTIHEMETSPAHYAGGPMQYMNSRVPEFKNHDELCCIYFGLAGCQNRPEPHQIYCAEHLEMMQEAEARNHMV